MLPSAIQMTIKTHDTDSDLEGLFHLNGQILQWCPIKQNFLICKVQIIKVTCELWNSSTYSLNNENKNVSVHFLIRNSLISKVLDFY